MGWTDESVEQLRQMWAKGLTANEIAKKLGVTKNAIVGKVHRLCLKARPSPIKNKTGDSPEKNDEAFDVEINDMPEIADEALEVFHEEKKPLSGTNVRLIDLDSHTCRWPIGDPRDEDFCFCGKKVRADQTYCDEHSAMAYVKANRK